MDFEGGKVYDRFIGSDDFEYEMEKKVDMIKEAGASIDTAEKLLGIMERHPLDDFGMLGAMVHSTECRSS